MEEDWSSLSEEEIPDSTCEKKKKDENSWEEDSSSSESSQDEEVEAGHSDRNQQKENNLTVKRDSSSSSSGSSSEEESDSDHNNENRDGKSKNKKKEDRKVWEDNPDIYGIRRSSRPRKEPQRLVVQSESEDSGDKKRGEKKVGRSRNDSWIPTLSGSESEESDSSFDVPQKKQPKRVFKKHSAPRHKQQRGRAISTSSDEYGKKRNKRTISRNSSSKVSYKEDTEGETDSDDIIEQEEYTAAAPDQDVETIEKIMRHRQGRPGNIGAQTTIYAEEAEELSRLTEPDPEKEETELQFLIKWKSWSHLHNTWETKDSLMAQKAAGMKKFENYVKRLEEIRQWKKNSSPEDVEYFELQVEMNEDIQKQYQKVERIIAHQFTAESNSSYPDYLCKWQGLPYSESTWEDGSLTARFFQSEIDLYLERERSDTIPNKNAKCLRQKPKFVPFKKQPSYLGSEELRLRDYQLDGMNWLTHAWCRELSIILADEMGLGKTIQTISFLSCLFHTHNLYGPFLAVVPLSTLDAWQREFQLWGSDMNVIVYIGDVNSRTKIQEYEWCFKKSKKLKFNVLLTTYEMLLRDKELLGSLNWAVLLIDEAHRLKNDDSLLYRSLVDFKTNFRLLITGTPLQNSLKELWSLMHFIMPNRFHNWEDFESQYSISDKEGLQKLHRDLEPFLLRRVKKDVEKSLPAKVEQILRMEMSTVQKQYYKLILTKNVKELCRELKGSFSGLLNIIVELKKCCNHANLIKPLDPVLDEKINLLQTLIKGSGKMILLDKLLCRLKETGHRVLIFSQMVRMLDIIADYLHLKRFAYQRLDGSIRGELRKRALDHFNAEGSQDFCFLLSTRAGGLGINLASADTVIIFDSDWNPQNDLQAMARAHRIGQKNQVNIYRFVTKNTIEEDIIERAKRKMVLDHLIIQRMDTTGRRILSKSNTAPSTNAPFNKEELSSILKFGAEDLFKETDQDTDQMLHAMDIDEILLRAETQEAHEGPSVGDELLSQFKVVNYAAFNEEEITVEKPNPVQKLWEEIIPEEDRKRIEEELEKQKKAELMLKPRSRKAVEKMNISLPSKKVKSKAVVDTDSSSSSDSDAADDNAPDNENAKDKKQPKKKAKVTAFSKEGVKGFTDNDVRRFVKSYKKFARPMTRLDSIAEDAELTDKSVSELKELAGLLKSTCEQAVKDYQEKLLQDEQFDGKKKGASVKISGVTINAPSVLKAENDLEPLASCLPTDLKQRKTYRLITPTRSVHWGIHWGVVEDSMLLVGMLIYGIGNWDAVKNDQSLGLASKILPMGNGKPQKKHLQSRAEYLLKLLKEQNDSQNTDVTKKKPVKNIKHKTKGDGSKSPVPEPEHSRNSSNQKIHKDEKPDKKEKTKKTVDKKKEKPLKKVKNEKRALNDRVTSPLIHEDNVSISDLREDMSEETFKKCKEKMRPERKSLQLLHTPDEKASSQEQVQTTKSCLLKIGDHIERCLDEYNNTPSALDSWRSNLWSFVAKFTELGPSKLYKLYRTAFRKRDAHMDEKKKELQKLKANHSNTLHEIGKVLPPDRVELEEARKRALGMHHKDSVVPKIPKLNKMRIPYKEKSSVNNNEKEYTGRSRYQDRRSDDTRQSHLRPPSRNNKPIDQSESSESTISTYKEWKEAKLKRKMQQGVVADEKPPQQENKHLHRDKPFYKDKPTYSDEKRIHKHDQYPSFDARNRPRYHKDILHPSISPSYRKSPSASQSPVYYGDRKRNSSNNSDLHMPSSKRHHRETEHNSNSNQSWTADGNT